MDRNASHVLLVFVSAWVVLLTSTGAFAVGVKETYCDGESVSWADCRAALIQKIFNSTTLPQKAEPDSVEEVLSYEMSGWPSPGAGVSPNGSAGTPPYGWRNGLQRLTWNISSPFISLNSTVLYSFNTSGNAPANYPPPPAAPGHPTPASPGFASFTARGRTLVLYHNGHETADCTPNYDGVVDHFNELGYDVMELMMPLIGCNQAYQYGNPKTHEWFQQWEDKGDFTMRFFIEPVVLAVNYAKALGYDEIVMLGLSGGGWTTTVSAAVDSRIKLSIPVAGSVPKFSTTLSQRILAAPHWVADLPEGAGQGEGGGGDYEQNASRPMYSVSGFLGMYVLASIDPGRAQIQILHEWDSCCFAAGGLHSSLLDYNLGVAKLLNSSNHNFSGGGGGGAAETGYFRTVVTSGNYHQVNVRDKVIVAVAVEWLRRFGSVTSDTFSGGTFAPFDLLLQNDNEAADT